MSSSQKPPPSGLSLALLLLLLLSCASAPRAAAQTSGNTPTDDQGMYDYKRFSPSMAVVVVLIAALFFMAFFSIYVRHCNDANSASIRVGSGSGAAGTGRSGRGGGGPRGLDPAVVATFPTLVYLDVKGLKIGKSAPRLNEFEDDETLRLIPKCDHVFHPDCVDAWLWKKMIDSELWKNK